jgi:hypothetical protein
MADMAAATHANILRAIRDCFQQVGGILAEGHATIAVERDQAQVVRMLRTAIGALTLIGGGDAAVARDRARNRLRAILQALEARS